MKGQAATDSHPSVWRLQGWLWLAQVVLVVALAWSVHESLGWPSVVDAVLATPLAAWGAGTLGLLASYGLRAYRLQLFMKDTDATVISALAVIAKHNLLCVTVPMRAGEAALPLLLTVRFGLPYRDGIGTLVALRLLDVYALVGCLLVFTQPLGNTTLLVLVAWAAIPGIVTVPRVLKALQKYPAIAYVAARLSVQPRLFVWSWVLWSLKLIGFATFLNLAASANFGTGILGALGGELASVLPVQGPAGLGTYEAGIVGGLALADTHGTSVVAAGVSLHILVLVMALSAAPISALMAARDTRP